MSEVNMSVIAHSFQKNETWITVLKDLMILLYNAK